ncbi:hypothetical protein PHJA_002850400 [Phtheirospermum japonicum]|uniref:Late embryogenesis abundant protein LEA-2 subgroup domain-containing protein n=1 Tax=Phtheirospermum japonicum TaxID=374723 RepID=A0A830D8S2_9LAMI|nr:hypothetical protein PHJA_002850400 [Phtheirospermum japonicum]
MVKSRPPHKPRPTGRTNLASCIVATVFLLFLIIVVLIVYFTIFKPQNPKLAVNAVQIPAFSAANSTLFHGGTQVGFMFIPAGKIAAGRTQYMAATFSVQPFPLPASGDGGGVGQPESAGPTRDGRNCGVQGRAEPGGGVEGGYGGHVEARADCRVSISVGDGSVSGFHC